MKVSHNTSFVWFLLIDTSLYSENFLHCKWQPILQVSKLPIEQYAVLLIPLKSPAKNAISPQNNSQKMSLFSVQWKPRFIQGPKSSWSPGALGCTLLSHCPEHKWSTSGWGEVEEWVFLQALTVAAYLLHWLMCASTCLCNHVIVACTQISSEIFSEKKRTAVDLSTRSSLLMIGSVSMRPIKQ